MPIIFHSKLVAGGNHRSNGGDVWNATVIRRGSDLMGVWATLASLYASMASKTVVTCLQVLDV